MRIEDAIKQKNFKNPYSKALVNLLYTNSYIISNQAKLFKPYGLSPEQYNVLRILRGQYPDPITVSSIQDRMLNKMSNASRLVEKLKQKDMVSRIECPSDRRQVDITITKTGLSTLADLENEVDKFIENIINLNTKELEQLNELLDKLRG